MTNINYSIIIPHYNSPDLLSRLINTIPERQDLEVIVVDDNSSVDVVNSDTFPGKDLNNVTCIFDKKGGGGGYARNIGLEKAHGKWVIFADSDDLFSDNFSELLDESSENESDIIFFKIKEVLNDDLCTQTHTRNKDFLYTEEFISQEEKENYYRYFYTEPWGKIIKRELINNHNIRFDETKVCNDYWFSVQTSYFAKKVNVSEKLLYIVTTRANSVSREYNAMTIKTRLNIGLRILDFFTKNKIDYKFFIPDFPCFIYSLLKKKTGLGIKYIFKILFSNSTVTYKLKFLQGLLYLFFKSVKKLCGFSETGND